MPHSEVTDLPDSLQRALHSVGYGRKSVEVLASENASRHCAGGRGSLGFCVLVDLATGRSRAEVGSWGGSNMFNPGNAVDCDTSDYPLPVGAAVINGSRGGDRPVHATITVHPDNVAKLLPAGEATLTPREAWIVGVVKGYNSRGRREQWEGMTFVYGDERTTTVRHIPPSEAEWCALVARGLIKRNRAGAVQITTAGRNAFEQQATHRLANAVYAPPE